MRPEQARWPGSGALRSPTGLARDRLWRWCVLRTVREASLREREGRRVSAHTLARRFERRWWRAVGDDRSAPAVRGAEIGRNAIGKWSEIGYIGVRTWREIVDRAQRGLASREGVPGDGGAADV